MRSDSLIGYRLEIRITYSNVALKRVNGELFPSRQLKKKAYIPYPKGIGVLRHSYKTGWMACRKRRLLAFLGKHFRIHQVFQNFSPDVIATFNGTAQTESTKLETHAIFGIKISKTSQIIA
jgi:hypothetical protein